MMTKKFTRTVENFVCERCGAEVRGDGYTNHCPECLWSKHVDVNPGDRQAVCGGMMAPVGVEGEVSDCSVVQKCLNCGHIMKNKVSKRDNFTAVLEVVKRRG